MSNETIKQILTVLDFVSYYPMLVLLILWQIGLNLSSGYFNKILKAWKDGETRINFQFKGNSICLWIMENTDRLFWDCFTFYIINIIIKYLSKAL